MLLVVHVPFALKLKRTEVPRELHGDCVTKVLGRIPSTELVSLSENHSMCFDGESSIDREPTHIISASTDDLICFAIELQRALVRSMPNSMLNILSEPYAVVKRIFLIGVGIGNSFNDDNGTRSWWFPFVSTVAEEWAENNSNKSTDTANHTWDDDFACVIVVTRRWITSARSTTTYREKNSERQRLS